VADADERVRTRMAEADARLAAAEQEIAERTRQDLGELADRRATLQADVDALTAFLEQHRIRMRAELERQLAELDASNPSLSVPPAPEVHEVDLGVPVHEPIDVPAPPPVEAPAAAAEPMTFTPTEAEVAQAREDLLEALRRAGVEELIGEVAPEALLPDTPGAEAVEPTPEPGAEAFEPTPEPAVDLTEGPRPYDADDESGQLRIPAPDDTAAFDVLAQADDGDDDVHWRNPSGPTPAVVDDDPFLAELRRAVTDTEPLGPRDHDDVLHVDDHDDAVPSGRFRLRRGR
jgi:hypothetical protein